MTKTYIEPRFRNEEDRNIVIIGVLIAFLLPLTGIGIALPFLAPLITYMAFKDKLSDSSKEILRAYTNFLLFALIAGLVIAPSILLLGLGILLEIILAIYVFIHSLIGFLAIINNTPVQLPIFIEFIKKSADIQYYENQEK